MAVELAEFVTGLCVPEACGAVGAGGDDDAAIGADGGGQETVRVAVELAGSRPV